MNLLTFLLASLGIFALLQFFWIPLTQRRLQADRTMAAISRAAAS